MKARLTVTVMALVLTATTFSFAQIDPGLRNFEVRSLDQMSRNMEYIGMLLHERLNKDLPPGPCKYGELLPAVRDERDGSAIPPDPYSYGDLLPAVRDERDGSAFPPDPCTWGDLLPAVRDIRDGSAVPPDPCKYGDLLPAVKTMIDFCNQMSSGDSRYAEAGKLLAELQELLRAAESSGVTGEMAARMAADYLRIIRLLQEIQDTPASGLR